MTKNELLSKVYHQVSQNPEWYKDVIESAVQARESDFRRQALNASDYYNAMVNALALVSEKRLSKRLKDYLNESLVDFFKKSDNHCSIIKDFVKKVEGKD